MTKSQQIARELNALLRARNPLIWIVTREEARAEQYIFEAAAAASYVPRTWDVAAGVCRLDGQREPWGGPDIGETLDAIKARSLAQTADRGLWVLRDAPVWMEGMIGAQVMRKLRNLARTLPGVPRDRAQAVIVLTTSPTIPPELAGHATVIEWPLPDRAEIASILDAALDALPDEIKGSAAPNGQRDAAIDAAIGLSGEEAQSCFARSLVQLRRIDPASVSKEKRRVIAREKVLEWFDPVPGGMANVGGLDLLKAWLAQRRLAYSPEARAYGLPAPKGAFLVGPPGTGKSLTAKTIATEWSIPLLRFDLGALKSKFVGDSEANIRRAFAVIESVGRCVVWIDEIEKALAGATSGSADGGVSSDALGSILSWMQERRGEAFVLATSNDVEALPPELLRKGRFDELFFVDLPTEKERALILAAALVQVGRGKSVGDRIDAETIAAATEGFTGSEIAALVPEAMFAAFSDPAFEHRQPDTGDFLEAAKTVVPLSKTAAEKITRLRDWAKDRARPASSPETAKAKAKRVLDI